MVMGYFHDLDNHFLPFNTVDQTPLIGKGNGIVSGLLPLKLMVPP